jgi:hypothetical protein
MADSEPPDKDNALDEEEPKSRTGRFHVQHRGGTRIEVGDPIKVGGAKPWLCAVKLVGQKRDDSEPEPTQTLLVRTGRGDTPEEAQREAIAHLTLVYGNPLTPPTPPVIELKESQRPPKKPDSDGKQQAARPSFFDSLKGWFKK